MAFMGMIFAGAALVILCICAFLTLLFLILAIVFKKKKIPRIVFTALTVLNFLPIAGAVWLVFVPHPFTIETPDGEVKMSAGKDKRLTEAIAEQDLEEIDRLLEKYPALTFYRDINGRTVLEHAMFANDIEMMSCALKHGAAFDEPVVYDRLIYGCSLEYYFYSGDEKNYDTVKYMIDNGAAVEFNDKRSAPNALFPAVWYICQDGLVSDEDITLLQLLIDSGADVNEASTASANAALDEFMESASHGSGVVRDDRFYKAAELLGGVSEDR